MDEKPLIVGSLDTLAQLLSHNRSSEGVSSLLDLTNEYKASVSMEKSGLQSSVSFRIQRRARLISQEILTERGTLDKDRLHSVIQELESYPYILYPEGSFDALAMEHMLSVLKRLESEPSLAFQLESFKGPLCHTWADELVLSSCGIFSQSRPSDCQIKVAALGACLTSLRQNVGSCFATAPAIVIQQDQVSQLLIDLQELLLTGKLKRTFMGVENSVPMSPSSGGGDLYKYVGEVRDFFSSHGFQSALLASGVSTTDLEVHLEAFESEETKLRAIDWIHKTLLSLSGLAEEDLTIDVSSSTSLIESQELASGIQVRGLSKRQKSRERFLEQKKRAVTAFKACVDHPLLKVWEYTLASFAESKMDFSKYNLYTSLGFHAEEAGGIGQRLFRDLQKRLDEDNEKIEEYDREYQIAFDQVRFTESLLKKASSESEARRLQAELTMRAHHMRTCLEMRDQLHFKTKLYATFLSDLFKAYERKFPEYFQEIYDADLRDFDPGDYEDSPAGFRLVYKHGRESTFLWTRIYSSEQYLEALADFFRAVEPLIQAEFEEEVSKALVEEATTALLLHIQTPEFLDSAYRRIQDFHGKRGDAGTPFAYQSGGSMQTLLQTYFKREDSITEETRVPDSPMDLAIFLIDTLKLMPLEAEKSRLLASSPSHAFTLIPHLKPLESAWKSDLFTYSWVRDEILKPGRDFYRSIRFSEVEQRFLLQELSKKVPEVLSHRVLQTPYIYQASIQEFCQSILQTLQVPGLESQLDAFLYEMLPLSSIHSLKSSLKTLFNEFEIEGMEGFLDRPLGMFEEVISAKELLDIAVSLYLRMTQRVAQPFDVCSALFEKAQALGLRPPAPLLFADSNWLEFYLGFVVSPQSLELELWRVKPHSTLGAPMTSWKKWLSPSNTSSWSVCYRPFEYTA